MTTRLVANRPFTDEELLEAVEAFERLGTKTAVATELGISVDSAKRRIYQAAERGLLGTEPVLPGYHISRVSRQENGDGVLERTWLTQTKEPVEPGEKFLVPDGQVIKGLSTLTDGQGRVQAQWVKTGTDNSTNDLVASLKAVFDAYEGKATLTDPPAYVDEDLLSVYPIADQHNGLLAWGLETGESYDLKIGEARLRECAARLIGQSPSSGQAIILNLGDYQHTDDQRNMTPGHGNLLDVDSRYFKILTAGVQLMQDVIDLALQRHGKVLVVNIPGNHDPHSSIALTVALSAFYRNEPRVTVYDKPADWFFHRFGQTLIGATHGHKAKPERMAIKLATSCREDWGLTRYHVLYYGHIHHESVKEVGDVRVESFQTLAGNDAWHEAGGYCSGKSLTSVTFHREEGEIGRHRVNVPAPPREVTQFEEAA